MTRERGHEHELRIVHLTGSIDPSAGGPAYSIPRLCESLRDAGATVDLLTLRDPKGGTITTPHHAFPVGRLPDKLGHAPAMWRWIKDRAQNGGIEIMHSHNLWIMPSIYPEGARRLWKIPHIVSPRGTLTDYSMSTGSRFKQIHWPLVQRPTLAKATCFHATAQSEVEDIRRLGFRQPIAVIPNGLDLPEWIDRPVHDTKVILFFGRIHPEKGLTVLLDAWARVQDQRPDWRLHIVGPDMGGHKAELERQIATKGIGRVVFGEANFGKEKFDIYRAAALYVLPSPTENFGLTVAEALAVGVPAIANHGAPWSSLVTERCGWWAPRGADPLADALLDATGLSHRARVEMGLRGRAYVARDFVWPTIAEQMAAVYRWVLARGERPACVQTD